MLQHSSEVLSEVLELLNLHNGDEFEGDIYEGDKQLLPRTPSFCVYSGDTERSYAGAQRYTSAVFTIYVMVYHSKIQDTGLTEREANQQAEAVADVLEADETLGGKVLDAFVTRITPGEILRGQSMYKATRVTLQVTSKFMIGVS